MLIFASWIALDWVPKGIGQFTTNADVAVIPNFWLNSKVVGPLKEKDYPCAQRHEELLLIVM